jgi:hypothetical protein
LSGTTRAQTAADWTVPGGANFILDNLIAQGKAKPMIVVMPLGYGGMDVVSQTLLSEILPEVEFVRCPQLVLHHNSIA